MQCSPAPAAGSGRRAGRLRAESGASRVGVGAGVGAGVSKLRATEKAERGGDTNIAMTKARRSPQIPTRTRNALSKAPSLPTPSLSLTRDAVAGVRAGGQQAAWQAPR
eukprot:3273455-Prymnesium_polylepis.1